MSAGGRAPAQPESPEPARPAPEATSAHHLAQLNVGRFRGPIDGPVMAGFAALLEPLNALADDAPGFVWRLQTAAGDAIAVEWPGDPTVNVNLSVWTSLQALRDYVYATRHLEALRRRREWFQHLSEHYQVLWWVPAGHLPTVEEAQQRLTHLTTYGPTPEAFTFRTPFPAPTGARPSVR